LANTGTVVLPAGVIPQRANLECGIMTERRGCAGNRVGLDDAAATDHRGRKGDGHLPSRPRAVEDTGNASQILRL